MKNNEPRTLKSAAFLLLSINQFKLMKNKRIFLIENILRSRYYCATNILIIRFFRGMMLRNFILFSLFLFSSEIVFSSTSSSGDDSLSLLCGNFTFSSGDESDGDSGFGSLGMDPVVTESNLQNSEARCMDAITALRAELLAAFATRLAGQSSRVSIVENKVDDLNGKTANTFGQLVNGLKEKLHQLSPLRERMEAVEGRLKAVEEKIVVLSPVKKITL